MDKLSPADKTLFIDADCLCFAPLESVFARFEGHTVSVIGKTIVEGDFFGDVRAIRQRFSLDYLPYFVGGIYYFEKSDLCTQIFDFARSIELKYDEIGLIRLRGRPTEEPLMAIAMSVHGQTPLLEDGTVKAEPMFYPSGIVVDVIKGYASLYNHKHDHCHAKVWGISESNPKIVHFHCSNIERYQYKSECFKLQKVIIEKWNYNLANMYAWLRFAIPELMIKSFKRMFRPLYQKFFGVRSIRKSERIV